MVAVTGKYSARLFWIVLVVAKFFFCYTWDLSFYLGSVVYLITGGWRFVRICLLTVRRDIFALSTLLRISIWVYFIGRRQHGLREVFASVVRRRGRDTIAMLCQDEKWTFGDVDDYSNQIANFLHAQGIGQHENIALFMESCPRYSATWLGAAKVGIATGLLNSNIRQKALEAGITQIKPKALIVGGSLTKALTEAGIAGELPEEDVVLLGPNLGARMSPKEQKALTFKTIKAILEECPKSAPPPVKIPQKVTDTVLYIFTSGTTGLPKAAIITLTRYIFMNSAIAYFSRLRQDDVVYTPLPLYHTAGGILGSGLPLLHGIQQVIRPRFSASQFWSDCIRYDVTVVQYVGEIFRYLLHQPFRKEEKEHKVRLATGNGLRKEVWVDFVKRFGVERVVEFYGATESNANLCNSENKLGAVGYSSMIIPAAYPVSLVKTDLETGEVLRDPKTGLCQVCTPGEVGQMVGYVKHGSPTRSFAGYINRKESSRKVLRNVKKQGDTYFLSGDLLIQDEEGYFYFVDRLGDTFRWRGENVSTTEVENIVSPVINFADCAVYGVEVPHNEGRAGMLSLVSNPISRKRTNSIKVADGGCGDGDADVSPAEQLARETQTLNDLAVVFAAQLPVYARPLFVRFSKAIDTTDTFKFRKMAMVREGFDPHNTTDHIYYLNTKANVYQRLDETVYNQIMENKIRF
uniref:Long-chain-fatty-acid--CoA ligase n=1 Tax=Schistocephalus solidus TaxID=70667 RepID=A0A0X3NLB8_SCHSO